MTYSKCQIIKNNKNKKNPSTCQQQVAGTILCSIPVTHLDKSRLDTIKKVHVETLVAGSVILAKRNEDLQKNSHSYYQPG